MKIMFFFHNKRFEIRDITNLIRIKKQIQNFFELFILFKNWKKLDKILPKKRISIFIFKKINICEF